MPGGPGAATFEADRDSIEVSNVRPAPDRTLAWPYRQGRDSFAAGVAVTATPGYAGPFVQQEWEHAVTDHCGVTRPGLPHPRQPTAANGGTHDDSASRESAAIRWLMRARVHMASAAVRLRCQCRGAEAARHESQNENSARRPGAGRPHRGFTASTAHRSDGPHDDMP